MKQNTTSKHSIHVIALDETEIWDLPEFADKIERIETVFAFDSNVHVHCCEMTPSYELWPVETRAILKDKELYGTREGQQLLDDIDSEILVYTDYDAQYRRVSTIDRLIQHLKDTDAKFQYAHCGDWDFEDMEECVQHLRENAAI